MKKQFALILVLAFISLCILSCRERCADGNTWETVTSAMNEMTDLMNEARAAEGVHPLNRTILGLVAINHSKDMACRNFFDHVNPDGETPVDRVQNGLGEDYQPPYVWIAENIGLHNTAREQFDNWMSSVEGHRENILDDRVNELGIALVYKSRGSDYTHYWTAVFLGRHSR
jgi:uncharacterized protein YkwD